MILDTPFGPLHPPSGIKKERVDAVVRALDWCEEIATGSLWSAHRNGERISLCQIINGHSLEMFPLEAARLDLGLESTFASRHLPIHLNRVNACVRFNRRIRPIPLHTDMIASMVLLLGSEDFPPSHVPYTLHEILTSEQLAELPTIQPTDFVRPQRLDDTTFTITDGEAFEFFTAAPVEQWLHHARRLCPHRQPNTLRWILFTLIEDPFQSSTWANEQLHSNPDLYSMVHIENALSHQNPLIRSWAVMNYEETPEKVTLARLLPMRYDGDSTVVNRVLSRIRGLSFSEQQKCDHISPLLEDSNTRGIAINHIGHLSLNASKKLELLGPFLSSDNPEHVVSTIRALRDSGCRDTDQALVQCFRNEDRHVVRCLLQCITSFGPWFEPHAKKLVDVREVQLDMVKALGKSHGFNQIPLLKSLIEGERNTLIVRGMQSLSKIRSDEAIELIGSYLLTHESRYVRRNAAEYLGETGRIAALSYLHQVGDDISFGVKDSAKRSIEKIKSKHEC